MPDSDSSDRPLDVVAVSGSLHTPSKTSVLLREILDAFGRQQAVSPRLIELTDVGPGFAGTLRRDELPDSVEEVLRAVESADVLVVGSPVYRA